MVKLLLFFIFIPSAFAINGVITVLEAPIFAEPDESTKVIQYYRKGQDIYIHPQEAEEKPYKDEDFKYLELVEADIYSDPLLDKPYVPAKDSRFYKTLARSGREAYILKEHVFLEFKDAREIGQDVIDFDHTDYRIEEPLPKGFPFKRTQDYRGNFLVGLGQPNYDPYPYREQVIDQSFNISSEFNFTWSKAQEIDPDKKFFFGAIGGFNFSQMQFLLTTQTATQRNFRLYIGPHASYDLFRNQKNRFAVYMNTQVYLLDNMDVSITDNVLGGKEQRSYRSSFGIAPNAGVNYHILDAVGKLNLILGANIRASLPRNYSTTETGSNSRIWKNTGAGDSYYQSFITEVTYFLGFQNNY